MEFTTSQQKAIDTKNCSLLVAAGAGSGKTRVLTERIINRIIHDSSADITDFLIVTFTKAAAKEMSDRIRRALTERSLLYPENKKLIRNIALLPQARISTISSFCLDMIKDNYEKLGLSPKLRIAEEDEIGVIIDRITDRLIESRLAEPEKYEYFLTVYENFSTHKSDTPFAEMLKSFYKSITNLPSVKLYLEDSTAHYRECAECSEVFDTFFGKLIKKYTEKDLRYAKELLYGTLEKSKTIPDAFKLFSKVIPDDITAIDNILCSLEAGFEETYDAMWQFSPANKPSNRNSDIKEFTDLIWMNAALARDTVKELRSTFYGVNSEIYKKCASDCFNITKELSDLLITLDETLAEEKKQNGIVSFSDVERLALTLLYDDVENEVLSDTAKTVSDSIKELYIDEYQDINPIQDMIFKALSKKSHDGYECNRFLVGDSKQSIYGFRGARPDIFNGYRHEFSDIDTESASRKRLFMQNNFRCAESVIDFTNMLFEKVMTEEYDESDRLIFSKISKYKVETPVNMLFCNTFAEKLSAEQCRSIEAEKVYDEIEKIVGNTDYLNSDGNTFSLNDITILTRTWNEAAFLEKFFTDKKIPVICERGESFFERDEIKLALNIIKSVDNPERNIATAGFMRSPVCGFTDGELALIRQASKSTSIFSALKKYTSTDGALSAIKEKAERFLELHSALRSLSRSCSAHDFVAKMYSLTDLINICSGVSYGSLQNNAAKIRRKNLSMLYDLARDFDKTVFKGISSFIEYIDNKISGTDMKKSASIASDGIHIMTLHKSKGLEFPVCFIFGVENSASGSYPKIIMEENTGFAFKLKSLEKIETLKGQKGFVSVDTPFKSLIKRVCDEAEETESKRLLYVGLTRACDLLYITACPKAVKDFELKIKGVANHKMTKGKTSLEMILARLYCEDESFTVETPGKYILKAENGRDALVFRTEICSLQENSEESEQTAEEKKIYLPDISLLESIKQKIALGDTVKSRIAGIPPKLTVSLLKHGLIDYEDTEDASVSQRNPLEMPEFIRESAEKTGAERGTAMHTFLQFADFALCENSGCEAESDRLCENGFITPKQREMLDVTKLDSFFKTPLYQHIKSAVKVHRELRFNLHVKPEDVIMGFPEITKKEKNNDFVLVQGVIDCFTENADGSYTVIDFKTDNVKENTAEVLKSRYSNQIAFYCRAVEDITKKKVSKAVIFSFATMEEIELDTDNMAFGSNGN